MAKYEAIKAKGANNTYTSNGGIGKKQLRWLEKRLQKAKRYLEKVTELYGKLGSFLRSVNAHRPSLKTTGGLVPWPDE